MKNNSPISYGSFVLFFAIAAAGITIADRSIAGRRGAEPAPTPTPTKSVSISATRTIVSKIDLHRGSEGGATCPETQKENSTTTISVNLNSPQIAVSSQGDTFQLQTHANADVDGSKPFSGGGSVMTSGTSDKELLKCGESSCPSSDRSQMQGEAKLDLDGSLISFNFDRVAHEGDFSLQFAFLAPSGQGTASHKDCHESHSGQVEQMAALNAQLMGVTFGTISAKGPAQNNPAKPGGGRPVPPNPLPPEIADAMKKALDASGNGGTPTIIETKSGFEISYSNSVSLDTMPPTGGWSGISQRTINTSVHISIGGKPVYYDAILVPGGDYKKWIPEGPLPPPKPGGPPSTTPPGTGQTTEQGNQISFTVKLVNKDRPAEEIKDVDFGVHFELEDDKASKIPGFATNFPKSGGDSRADLRFDPMLKESGQVAEFSDSSLRTKDDAGRDFKAIVRSYDYASRGMLKAKLTLKANGLDLDAHLADDQKEEVQLPFDSNGNHIADQWEKDMGIFDQNYPEKWDSLHLDGNSHDGDGLTLLEKYRGFVINGKHERLNPKVKHAFVVNQTDPFVDLSGHFRIFEAAAEGHIKVHVCLKDESDQIVNPTATEGKGGDQYAILVQRYTPTDPNEQGKMFPDPPRFKDTTIKSPKDADHLAISTAVTSLAAIDYVLSHELAHGFGVHHHGDSSGKGYTQAYEKFLKTTAVLIDAATNKTIPWSNLETKLKADMKKQNVPWDNRFASAIDERHGLEVARIHSQAAGDVSCLMTYNDFFELADLEDGIHVSYTGAGTPDGAKFCRNAKGTGWNANRPVSAFGDAADGKGDCWSQITIKTW